jgi:hypothetical protein
MVSDACLRLELHARAPELKEVFIDEARRQTNDQLARVAYGLGHFSTA